MFKIAWLIIDDDGDMEIVHEEPAGYRLYEHTVMKIVYARVE